MIVIIFVRVICEMLVLLYLWGIVMFYRLEWENSFSFFSGRCCLWLCWMFLWVNRVVSLWVVFRVLLLLLM